MKLKKIPAAIIDGPPPSYPAPLIFRYTSKRQRLTTTSQKFSLWKWNLNFSHAFFITFDKDGEPQKKTWTLPFLSLAILVKSWRKIQRKDIVKNLFPYMKKMQHHQNCFKMVPIKHYLRSVATESRNVMALYTFKLLRKKTPPSQ